MAQQTPRPDFPRMASMAAFAPAQPVSATGRAPLRGTTPLRARARGRTPGRAPPAMQVRNDFGSSTSDELSRFISDNLGRGPVTKMQRAGSSGWASMHRAETESGARFFVKVSRGDEGMFAGEAAGLRAMHATRTLRVPEVHHFGPLANGKGAFIVMEELALSSVYAQSALGTALARMHLAEPCDARAREGMFGFSVENTIGGTAQPNGWMGSWVEFFRERRLRHQLLLTGDMELIRAGEKVCDRMEEYFDGCPEVRPSILHGDLWSGNINGVDGDPVVYDPACYYGHHEAEFGMSWCAGFSKTFWAAYRDVIPKDPGFDTRNELYTLYHALNHYNLFGGGYRAMALASIHRLAYLEG